MAFATHLLGGAMLVVARTVAPVEFGAGQLEFLVLVGYVAPVIAMVLVWAKNYVYGAPLLVGATAANAWFVIYFTVVHDNPANIWQVADSAYTNAITVVVIGSLVVAGVGTWLWYAESEGFRSTVDRIVYPPEESE